MNIFNRLKRLMVPQKRLEDAKSNQNIYEELGIITPFTVLAAGQFNSFIGALANNKSKSLNDIEQGAFEELWNAACIDIDGFGNNIWNLKEGCFEIYNKDGIIVRFEKKKAQVKSKYEYSEDDGRANFVYLSGDGNFIINQNDRNKKVFLVYVSENISDRLLSVLSNAEAEALDLSLESNQVRNRLGIPKTLSIADTESRKNENATIQEKYRTNIDKSHSNDLAGTSKKIETSEREER